MADLGQVGFTTPGAESIPLNVWAATNITLTPVSVTVYGTDTGVGASLPLFQDWQTYSGAVLDGSGNPVVRTVRAYLRSTGALIGQTTSSAGTGTYSLLVATALGDEVQIICLDDNAGTLENDLIHRALTA
jgi:hypothetical protein